MEFFNLLARVNVWCSVSETEGGYCYCLLLLTVNVNWLWKYENELINIHDYDHIIHHTEI